MAGFFVGIRQQRRDAGFNERGRGHRAAIGENYHVGLILKGDVVVRQMVMLYELADHLPEALLWALRTRLQKKFCQCDTPGFLLSAMLPCDLIDPPFNWFPQAEVIPVQGQNFFIADRVKYPIRQLHLAPQKPTIETMLTAD